MRVAVLDHGMGNLRSVARALEAAGAGVVVSKNAAEIDRCDGLCVPGQGIFGRCMQSLDSLGLAGFVAEWVGEKKPYLGICLGMQVLFDRSEEPSTPAVGSPRRDDEEQKGLGLLPGEVRRLPPSVRVPHIGWNTVAGTADQSKEYFYFDHSYAVHPADETVVAGWSEHGRRFAAWVATESLVCVQFHPEKSGVKGIEFLKGWVS